LSDSACTPAARKHGEPGPSADRRSETRIRSRRYLTKLKKKTTEEAGKSGGSWRKESCRKSRKRDRKNRKRKVTSPTLGTGGKRLWLLRSRPDQVDHPSMRGGPSRNILPLPRALRECQQAQSGEQGAQHALDRLSWGLSRSRAPLTWVCAPSLHI